MENWREFCYFGGLGLEVGGCLRGYFGGVGGAMGSIGLVCSGCVGLALVGRE